jgi:hypothetical protein
MNYKLSNLSWFRSQFTVLSVATVKATEQKMPCCCECVCDDLYE